MPLGEAVFKSLSGMLIKASVKMLGEKVKDFRLAAEMEAKLKVCALAALSNLDVFFTSEGISTTRQEWLVDQCLLEIKPLLRKPEAFFTASLTGQKLYDHLYATKGAPEAIRHERLEGLFKLLFPRVADTFCAYLALIPKLKATGDREIFRRFDDIQIRLTQIQNEFTGFATKGLKGADAYFNQLHSLILNRVLGQLLVNGLHGERTYEVGLDDIFVLPKLSRVVHNETQVISNEDDTMSELFRRGRLSIVQGQPGGGKTTWTRWLQRLSLKATKPYLGVHLRFRDFSLKELPDVYTLIREPADVHLRKRVTNEIVDSWLEEGRVIFFLDGFDEVAPPKRDAVAAWTLALSQNASHSAVILTSRPLSTKHLHEFPEGWVRWEIQPFDEKQVETYISRWYACCPFLRDDQRNVDAKELARSWKHDKTVSDLTGNPLMLATLLTVHHRDNRQLPRGRSDLYKRYLDGMLGLWEESIQVERPAKLTPKQKRYILQRIALHFLLSDVESLGECEPDGKIGMVDLVKDILATQNIKDGKDNERDYARLVLEELRERTGMLDGPGTYSFIHKSVSEFLFAEVVVEGNLRASNAQNAEKIDRHWLFTRRAPDRWRGVLYFWAGLASAGDQQGFVEQLIASSDEQDRILGLGLLYDQASEMEVDWAKSQFAELISKPLKNFSFGSSHWIVGCMPEDAGEEVQVPDFESVAPARWSLYDAFDYLYRFLTVNHSDTDCTIIPWASLAWRSQIAIAVAEVDPKWWVSTKAIETAVPKKKCWFALAACFVSLSSQDKEGVPRLLDYVIERWPTSASLVQIVYIGVIVELIGIEFSPPSTTYEARLSRLHFILPWVKRFEPDIGLLKKTKKCNPRFGELVDSIALSIASLEKRLDSAQEIKPVINDMLAFLRSLEAKRMGIK